MSVISVKNCNYINGLSYLSVNLQTNKKGPNPAMAFLALQGIMARVALDFGDVQRDEASFAASHCVHWANSPASPAHTAERFPRELLNTASPAKV